MRGIRVPSSHQMNFSPAEPVSDLFSRSAYAARFPLFTLLRDMSRNHTKNDASFREH
jgi:hypothetical protein